MDGSDAAHMPLSPDKELILVEEDTDMLVYVLEALGVASFRSGNTAAACDYLERCLSVVTGKPLLYGPPSPMNTVARIGNER